MRTLRKWRLAEILNGFGNSFELRINTLKLMLPGLSPKTLARESYWKEFCTEPLTLSAF